MSRKAIPEKVKKIVRQRCKFGCVICGCPIYEYEHIKEYSKDKRHLEDNITLLCPTHHAQVTKGIINKDIVRKFNEKPYNKENELTSKSDLFFCGNSIEINFGSTKCEYDNIIDGAEFAFLSIKDVRVIYFKKIGDFIYFNCFLFDRKGNILLCIKDNELMVSSQQWDITFIGSNLIIKDNIDDKIIDISFQNSIIINNLKVSCLGVNIEVDSENNKFNDLFLSGGIFKYNYPRSTLFNII